MKLTAIMSHEEDEYETYSVTIETEEFKGGVSFMDGEPEDATMSRDFSDVYNIPELLKEAYKAGLRGESFEMGDTGYEGE